MGEIWIFGHSPSDEHEKFKTESEILEWMKEGLFEKEDHRYRYTQIRKDVSTIVVSFDGKVLGYFNVKDSIEPSKDDINQFSRSKWVYLIDHSNVFRIQNKASVFGIIDYQFGKQISEQTFEDIKSKGGGTDTFPKN